MYSRLLQRLNQLVLLNPKQQADLCQVIQVEEHARNHILLAQEEVANHIYFVEQGIVRSVCSIDGKEITRWFCLDGHFCAAHISFVTRQPSEDSLVLVTDCKLLSISHANLQHLFQKDSVWVDLNRHLLVDSYNALLERVLSFQTQSTMERYEHFLQEYPGLENKVALGHLASYLGMTQENLSRLRTRWKKRKL